VRASGNLCAAQTDLNLPGFIELLAGSRKHITCADDYVFPTAKLIGLAFGSSRENQDHLMFPIPVGCDCLSIRLCVKNISSSGTEITPPWRNAIFVGYISDEVKYN